VAHAFNFRYEFKDDDLARCDDPSSKIDGSCSDDEIQSSQFRRSPRVNLGNVVYVRLCIGGKTTMKIPGARWHTTYLGSRPRGGGSQRPTSSLVYDYNVVYREPS
jgi:hypothetical protein